jgi:hypothetical protein
VLESLRFDDELFHDFARLVAGLFVAWSTRKGALAIGVGATPKGRAPLATVTTDDGRYVMAYKFGLAFEPTKIKLELADLNVDWHIALMRGAERDVLRIRAELEAHGLHYNEEKGKWEETDVFASHYDPIPESPAGVEGVEVQNPSTPK